MKRGEEGGEHIKLYLRCSVPDAFQATSVVVSVGFCWPECCVKPVNEEQPLSSLSLRAEKAVQVGWESAWLRQHKTNVGNKLQLPLVWLSVMAQNGWNLPRAGRSGEQTNWRREGWSLKCLIGFAELSDICGNPLTSRELPKAAEGGRRKQFCALKTSKWKLLGKKE